MTRLSFVCLAVLAVGGSGTVRAEDAATFLAQADEAYSSKRYADAIPLYRIVVDSTQPPATRARAQNRVGYCWYRLGDKGKARLEWQAVFDRFPGEAGAAADGLLRAANVACASGDYPGGITLLSKSVTAYARQSSVAETMAETLLRLGLAHMHEGEISKHASPKGSNAAIAWDRGSASYAMARAAFTRIVHDLAAQKEQAAEAGLQLLALQYDDALWHGRRDLEAVVESADRFLQIHPNDDARAPVAYLIRAEAYIGKDDCQSALKSLDVILTKYAAAGFEAVGTARYLRADCMMAQHDYSGALEGFRAFLAGDAKKFNGEELLAQATYRIGLCLRELGRAREAIEALRDVRRLYPTRIEADDADRAAQDLETEVER